MILLIKEETLSKIRPVSSKYQNNGLLVELLKPTLTPHMTYKIVGIA